MEDRIKDLIHEVEDLVCQSCAAAGVGDYSVDPGLGSNNVSQVIAQLDIAGVALDAALLELQGGEQ